MRDCDSWSRLLGDLERLFERAELAPQRRDLLVEHLDLRQRAGRIRFSASSWLLQLGHLALRGRGAAAQASYSPL